MSCAPGGTCALWPCGGLTGRLPIGRRGPFWPMGSLPTALGRPCWTILPWTRPCGAGAWAPASSKRCRGLPGSLARLFSSLRQRAWRARKPQRRRRSAAGASSFTPAAAAGRPGFSPSCLGWSIKFCCFPWRGTRPGAGQGRLGEPLPPAVPCFGRRLEEGAAPGVPHL